DDTSSLKKAVIEWLAEDITKSGILINPATKPARGFNHPEGRAYIEDHLVNSSDWPAFLYSEYNPQMPWVGMLRGSLLLKASAITAAFKHVFLSPTAANYENGEGRGTRSGNVALHGMTMVTPASIAYIATHLLFALSSSCIFNKFNMDVDLVGFYRSIKGFFYDPEWADEAQDLLEWWNR
ncbi:hypothetical protein BKA93DRAFT_736256, partial [Sparassis latifolia]